MSTRADVLAGLERELAHAEGNGAVRYAARLRRKIAEHSQGSPASPATETLAAASSEGRGDARDKPVVPGRSRPPRVG